MTNTKTEKRIKRHKKIRSRVFGTLECPRLAVFRSNKFIYAQLINDEKGETLGAADSKKSKLKSASDRAKEVGTEIAKIAKDKKIEKVVFDRGGFLFAGAVKDLADSAREGGLKF
jgi:large subunit ribosomal protein L18